MQNKQQEQELARIRQKLEQQKKLLEQVKGEQEQLYSRMAMLITDGVKVPEIKRYSGYTKHLAEEISWRQEEYQQTTDEYQSLQQLLIQLLKEIDMLDKLKEKQFKEYLRDVHKQEEKTIEAVVNYKTYVQGGGMHD